MNLALLTVTPVTANFFKQGKETYEQCQRRLVWSVWLQPLPCCIRYPPHTCMFQRIPLPYYPSPETAYTILGY